MSSRVRYKLGNRTFYACDTCARHLDGGHPGAYGDGDDENGKYIGLLGNEEHGCTVTNIVAKVYEDGRIVDKEGNVIGRRSELVKVISAEEVVAKATFVDFMKLSAEPEPPTPSLPEPEVEEVTW